MDKDNSFVSKGGNQLKPETRPMHAQTPFRSQPSLPLRTQSVPDEITESVAGPVSSWTQEGKMKKKIVEILRRKDPTMLMKIDVIHNVM
eukprot:254519-Amorphochlora_amoeboformis.AAC.1